MHAILKSGYKNVRARESVVAKKHTIYQFLLVKQSVCQKNEFSRGSHIFVRLSYLIKLIDLINLQTYLPNFIRLAGGDE
jgi:hypothetical protein